MVQSGSSQMRRTVWTSNLQTVSGTAPSRLQRSATPLLERCSGGARGYATSRDPIEVAKRFQDLGLNPALSRQLATAYPHIYAPTAAQAALVPAILAPNDVLLRAHTGTGKSFALFLALLAKPRIIFKESPGRKGGKNAEPAPASTGISSLLLVPTNELAAQYMAWAHAFLPSSALASLKSVVQLLVRPDGTFVKPPVDGSDSLLADVERLRVNPPHVLIATPTRVREILAQPDGAELLGLRTLRTLALDEADALLSLPGRFPARKLSLKGLSPFAASQTHRSPTLEVLDAIMRIRPTHSGGERLPSAGMEPSTSGRFLDEKRPPEAIRRIQHTASERSSDMQTALSSFAPPLPRTPYNMPLQLICVSATANSVLRHFLGARTGWLRTKIREAPAGSQPGNEKHITGIWLDLTGLSGKEEDSGKPSRKVLRASGHRPHEDEELQRMTGALPAQLSHSCVVVEPVGNEGHVGPEMLLPRMKNLDVSLARQAFQQEYQQRQTNVAKGSQRGRTSSRPNRPDSTIGNDRRTISMAPTSAPDEHVLDTALLDALAFCFASEAVARGVAFVPPRWSLRGARKRLEECGVPVAFVGEPEQPSQHADSVQPRLTLIQATSARGLDLPDLTHVFVLGMHAVGDAVRYTHLAGRASRIGHGSPLTLQTIEEANTPVTTEVASDEQVAAETTFEPDFRNPGKVVTLVHGVDMERQRDAGRQASKAGTFIGNDERRMALLYRRLGVRPVPFDLSLLEDGNAEVRQ